MSYRRAEEAADGGRRVSVAAEQRQLPADEEAPDLLDRERAPGAVPRPDAVVQTEQASREELRIVGRQLPLLDPACEERRPGRLELALARADGLARGLLARSRPARLEALVLREEDAVL